MEWVQGITGVPMRPRRSRRQWIAAAAVAAACLLGGASEKQVATGSPPPAPACQAPDEGRGAATMATVIESLRRHAAERPPGAVVVEALDNRGYNYPAEPAPLVAPPAPEPRPQR